MAPSPDDQDPTRGPGPESVHVIDAVRSHEHPCTSDITFRPGYPVPSHTDSFTRSSVPNRPASVAVNSSPASLTSRCSSNTIRAESRLAGPAETSDPLRHKGDLLLQARRRQTRRLYPGSGGH